jgi:S1-C subfamily serine protease
VSVLPNTPAASAGLRLGDVIVEVDGQAVTNAGELQTIVDNSRVGQQLQIKVKRGNQTQQLAVRTVELQNAA